MKKLIALFLSLLLCASVMAASLWTVGSAAEPDPAPDPKPTVTVIPIDPDDPGDPDGMCSVPPGGERIDTE